MDENNAKRRDELERAHYNPNQLHLSELTRYGFFRVVCLQFIWVVKLKLSFIRNLSRFHHSKMFTLLKHYVALLKLCNCSGFL